MQGKKRFGQKLFYNLSLEELVPEDHVLRRFDSLISLDFPHEETKSYYSHTGRLSVYPTILFKIMLLGYLFGISSERRLASEIRVNMAYRWYLGYDLDESTPNHSVLSKARRRFPEEVFADSLDHVVQLCLKAGLIGGETVHVDSTLVKANASLTSFVEVEEKPDAFTKRVCDENDFESDQPAVKDGIIGQHYDGNVDRKRMGRRRKRYFVNSRKRSSSDPDASIVYRPSTGRQADYKGHMAVDGNSRVVASVEVTTGSADDTTVVDSLLQRHIIRSRGRPRHLVGDSHYGISEAYRYLAGEGGEAVISPRRSRHRPAFLTVGDFKYDKGRDCCICPEGKNLNLKAHQRTAHRKAYVADKETCDRCRARVKCTTGRMHGCMITRFMDDYFEEAEQRVNRLTAGGCCDRGRR
jgi:transposase